MSASELCELEFFSREAAEHHQFPEDFLSKQFGEKKKSKVLKETPRIRDYESMAHNLRTYKYKLSCSSTETLSLMKKTLQVLKEKEQFKLKPKRSLRNLFNRKTITDLKTDGVEQEGADFKTSLCERACRKISGKKKSKVLYTETLGARSPRRESLNHTLNLVLQEGCLVQESQFLVMRDSEFERTI